MDWSNAFNISLTTDFCIGFLSIIFINIILSGDNAVVIAMAVRSLAKKQRMQGIIFGTAIAVVLRIVLTFFAAKLLEINFLKFCGGALITWIAIKLFIEGSPEESQKEVSTLGKAIVTILIADLVMSVDNVLAVAGACKGNLFLLLFGLGTSIPLVIFAAGLLSRLMDRYPIIVIIGAAVLGRVGGEMIIGDAFIQKLLGHPGQLIDYTVQAIFAVGVVVVGKLWMRRKARKEAALESHISTGE
jgi:YjbE family integral membrane protein